MSRFKLAPEAAADLIRIWRFIRRHGGVIVADRVESTILDKIGLLSDHPYLGHVRRDLTPLSLRFFPVYSYLIVYRAGTEPMEIVGNRGDTAWLS